MKLPLLISVLNFANLVFKIVSILLIQIFKLLHFRVIVQNIIKLIFVEAMIEPVDLEDEHDYTDDADEHVAAHLHELNLRVELVILHEHASTRHVENDQRRFEDRLNLYLFVQPLQLCERAELQGSEAEHGDHEENWEGVGDSFWVI